MLCFKYHKTWKTPYGKFYMSDNGRVVFKDKQTGCFILMDDDSMVDYDDVIGREEEGYTCILPDAAILFLEGGN